MKSRRILACLLVAFVLTAPFFVARSASFYAFNGFALVNNTAPVPLEILISYGQSWRVNDFPSFTIFGVNPKAILAMLVSSLGAFLGSGPLPSGAGVSLAGTIKGVTEYGPNDTVAIGRVSGATQQLLRVREGVKLLPPVLEANFSYPGSTWTTGGGGGLGPGATGTASITNDVLTVTNVSSGAFAANQIVVMAGIDARTIITGLGSGNGGTGTYNVTIGQFFIDNTLVMEHATVIGKITGGSSPGNTLSITQVLSGTVTVGDTVPAPAIAGTTIISGSGLTWITRAGAAQSVASEAVTTTGTSWKNMTTAITQFLALFPTSKYTTPVFKGFAYTQGGSQLLTNAGKVQDLTDMLTLVDAKNLPGAGTTGMKYYLSIPAPISTAITADNSVQGTYTFARTNAPGAGGPWSGRAFATFPSYPYQFNGNDNIHTDGYGSAREGEIEGYIRHRVQDFNESWEPLWRDRHASITVSGKVVTIPFSRPVSADFATAPMVFGFTTTDGIKDWPQQGFHIKKNNVECTGVPIIVDMTVQFTTDTCVFAPGDVANVGYAWNGPGGTNPGLNSGVGGNLHMIGPPSPTFAGLTIDAWAWAFNEDVTVQ